MAHYDCTDCGASMGIGYGSCKQCTPKEYFELDARRVEIRREAEKYVEEQLKQQREILFQHYLDINDYEEIEEKLKQMRLKARGLDE